MSSSTTTTTQNSAENGEGSATDQQQQMLTKVGGGSDFTFATLIVTLICGIYDCVTCSDMDKKPEQITDFTSMTVQTDFNILSSSRVLNFMKEIGETAYDAYDTLWDNDENTLKLPRGDEISFEDAEEFINYIECVAKDRKDKKRISEKWTPILQYVMDYCNLLLQFNVEDFKNFIGLHENGIVETQKGLSSKSTYTVKLNRKQKKAADDASDTSEKEIEYDESEADYIARVEKKREKLARELTWETRATVIALGRVINWLLVQKKEGDKFVNHKRMFDTNAFKDDEDDSCYDYCKQLSNNFGSVVLSPLNLVCNDIVEVPDDPVEQFLEAHRDPNDSQLIKRYKLKKNIVSKSTSQLRAKHGANNDMIEMCKNVELGFFHVFFMDIKGHKLKTESANVNHFLSSFNKYNNLPDDHALHALYKKEERSKGASRAQKRRAAELESVRAEAALNASNQIVEFMEQAMKKGWSQREINDMTSSVWVEKTRTWEQAFELLNASKKQRIA